MRTLAILTNGGDTCALNASIKSIRDNAYRVGYKKIYGIRRGYQGLLDGSIDSITHKEIDVRKGGSFLGSMRESPAVWKDGKYVPDESKCWQMARCLADYEIDVLVVIGGDGTLQSTQLFQQWILEKRAQHKLRSFELLGFLKTIDNDVRTKTFFKGIEVALCPGFPSAVRKIVSTFEDLRVTARTGERAFAVECMGRDAGWLAASGTFGGAELVIVPEIMKLFKDDSKTESEYVIAERVWSAVADTAVSYYEKDRNVIIAVAEGFDPPTQNENVRRFVEVIHDLYGPRKKVGATELLTLTLSPVLQYYFWCLSKLSQELLGSPSVASAIDRVVAIDDSDEYRKYNKEVIQQAQKHPLFKHSVKDMLYETFGVSEPAVDVTVAGAVLEAVKSLGPEVGWERPPASEPRGRVRLSVPPYRFELRPHRTDYLPRSGEPSPYDYKLATVLGEKIGEMLENREFGFVPAMAEVVPYSELKVQRVKTESISEIRTLDFSSPDYFKPGSDYLKVSDRITDFFRTIMSGPKTLEEAISEKDKAG